MVTHKRTHARTAGLDSTVGKLGSKRLVYNARLCIPEATDPMEAAAWPGTPPTRQKTCPTRSAACIQKGSGQRGALVSLAETQHRNLVYSSRLMRLQTGCINSPPLSDSASASRLPSASSHTVPDSTLAAPSTVPQHHQTSVVPRLAGPTTLEGRPSTSCIANQTNLPPPSRFST